MKAFLSLTVVALTTAMAAALCACAANTPAAPAQTASIANSCINPTQISEQKIVSDTQIQFTLNNREVWVNTLPRACPGLKFQQAFSWDVRGTLVCSNQQTIRVKDEGTLCQLGAFTRLPAPPA